jgi:predicted component of type VI protein secretion system
MALTLKLRSGDLEPLPELHFDAPRVVVGRAKGSDLQLPDPSVSSRHASFRERGSEYVLVDEGSDNGTFAGSVRLSRQAAHTLSDGDLVRFGRIWVEVGIGPAPSGIDVARFRELARELVEHALAQDDQPRGMSVTLEPAGEAGPLLLEKPRHAYVVGTQKSASLRLSGSLPPRCLELRRHGDQLWVTRLSDDVEAELEGVGELPSGERTLWPSRAVLKMGERRFRFEDRTGVVLERLERGPTERLPEDAAIDPPRGSDVEPEIEEEMQDDSADESWADASPRAAAAPAAPKPQRWAANPKSARWTSADALVFFLAMCVLGLSLLAIRWLSHVGA